MSGTNLEDIKGITYKNGSGVFFNKEESQIEDVSSIEFPLYEIFDIQYYRLFQTSCSARTDFILPIMSGRGCRFSCSFCYNPYKNQRLRTPQNILSEIELLQKNHQMDFPLFQEFPLP